MSCCLAHISLIYGLDIYIYDMSADYVVGENTRLTSKIIWHNFLCKLVELAIYDVCGAQFECA